MSCDNFNVSAAKRLRGKTDMPSIVKENRAKEIAFCWSVKKTRLIAGFTIL